MENGVAEKPRLIPPQWYRRPRFWAAVVAGIIVIWVGYKAYHIYRYELPSIEQVYNIEPPLKTRIYSADGTVLQDYYNQNRVLTPYVDIPPHMVKMLLAVEDQEFYHHWGINPRRIFILAINNLLKMQIEGGASTITQQVARMLFLNREQTLVRKLKEALTAVKLERTYSKNEILEMYLNLYYFHRAYGISAAAHAFFNKKASELNINDCAILLGMLRGPAINSPFAVNCSRGSRSQIVSSPAITSSAPGSSTKNPPLIHEFSDGFSRKESTLPCPSRSMAPNLPSGWTEVIVTSLSCPR